MESSKFYLHVARLALRDLKALPADDVRLGGWTRGEKPRWEEIPSDHFRDAPGDVQIAEEAVEAIQKARGEPEWNP